MSPKPQGWIVGWKAIAARAGVSVHTARNEWYWRRLPRQRLPVRHGPGRFSRGQRVRITWAALEAWLEREGKRGESMKVRPAGAGKGV